MNLGGLVVADVYLFWSIGRGRPRRLVMLVHSKHQTGVMFIILPE